jgi:serine/threonine-protein kinase
VTEAGRVLGDRYRLVRKFAEGGIGEVWEAEHTALGTRVAVKFLQHSSPETTARFLREARVAASVRHQNIVHITDFGEDHGKPYMVMELLEGVSLAERLNERPAPDLAELLRMMSLTLRGLAVVHDAGIVHRDMKPENIFLVTGPDGTFPKLLDFGISRSSIAGSGTTSMTHEGMILGTPDYMSPEQARGLPDIDKRTDVFSMGVILFELVTGRLPFVAQHVGDLIAMIATKDPPSPAELVPDISPSLREVIETAMSRDRERRYGDARAMRLALMRAVPEDEGVQASGLMSASEFPSRPSADLVAPVFPKPTPMPRLLSAAERADRTPTGEGARSPTPSGSIPFEGRRSFPEREDSAMVFAIPEVASEGPSGGRRSVAPADDRGGAGIAVWMVLAVLLIAGTFVAIAFLPRKDAHGFPDAGAYVAPREPVGSPAPALDAGVAIDAIDAMAR